MLIKQEANPFVKTHLFFHLCLTPEHEWRWSHLRDEAGFMNFCWTCMNKDAGSVRLLMCSSRVGCAIISSRDVAFMLHGGWELIHAQRLIENHQRGRGVFVRHRSFPRLTATSARNVVTLRLWADSQIGAHTHVYDVRTPPLSPRRQDTSHINWFLGETENPKEWGSGKSKAVKVHKIRKWIYDWEPSVYQINLTLNLVWFFFSFFFFPPRAAHLSPR